MSVNHPVYADFRTGYLDLIQRVLGQPFVSPRGLRTVEWQHGGFVLMDPHQSLPLGIGRAVAPAVAAVEAIQLIGGFSDPTLMLRINPRFEEFTEQGAAGLYFHGAYGPRVGPQLGAVVQLLREDPDTRQAVVTVYQGDRDHVKSRDIPCTLSLHFMLREGQLQLHVTMRSNDVWWGTAYDVFQFTQLQLTVANLLGVVAGCYFHTANSLHLYERDWPAAAALRLPDDLKPVNLPRGLGRAGQTVREVQERACELARAALEGRDLPLLSADEAWYLRRLRYRADHSHTVGQHSHDA